jgi:glycosyltransferase involved in cell wall biosynthesis
MMKISVVIPAFNEERLLGESLAKIKSAAGAFTGRGWEVELIVCDNNSTDRTAEIARAAGATVVLEPVNQIARARNTGAAAATGDWLVFVDADSHPSAELFGDVAGQILSGRCLAGGATIRLDEHHLGRRNDHLDVELRQPDFETARRFIYFLRRGGVSKDWRLQPRTVCGGGIGTGQAAEKTGA